MTSLGPTIITDLGMAFCKKCGYPFSQMKSELLEKEEGTCPSCAHPWVEDLAAPVFKPMDNVQTQYVSNETKQCILDIKNSLEKIEGSLEKIADHIKHKEFKERIGI